MSNGPRPSSLDGIKRLARTLKAERGITHTDVLEVAARQAGYQSYTHARHQLESKTQLIGDYPVRPKGGPNVGHDEFLDLCRDAWMRTLHQLNPARESRLSWTSPAAIREALTRLLSHTRSHAHLPTGGGLDFERLQPSTEPGVFAFEMDHGSVHLARPRSLTLEWIERRPTESFVLLELAELAPSGAYEPDDDDPGYPPDHRTRRREEVLELAAGDYVDRSVWDQGDLGYDDEGRRIPLPEEARLATRWFNGKILFVTKGSLWNGTPATYDGRHDRMSADQIRSMIERSLPPDLAAE